MPCLLHSRFLQDTFVLCPMNSSMLRGLFVQFNVDAKQPPAEIMERACVGVTGRTPSRFSARRHVIGSSG